MPYSTRSWHFWISPEAAQKREKDHQEVNPWSIFCIERKSLRGENSKVNRPHHARGEFYRYLLVQPCDIVSQDIVDVDGSPLYATVNSIKEVKCLICDMVTRRSIEFRVLCSGGYRQRIEILERETTNRPALLWWSQEEFERNVWDQASPCCFAFEHLRVPNKQLGHIASWKCQLVTSLNLISSWEEWIRKGKTGTRSSKYLASQSFYAPSVSSPMFGPHPMIFG